MTKIGHHVAPHLTRMRFSLEGLKFCICLAIPGFSVYFFRVPHPPVDPVPRRFATAANVISMPEPTSPATCCCLCFM